MASVHTRSSGRPHHPVLDKSYQEEQAKKRLRELIQEGLSSGPGQALSPKRVARLRKQTLDNLR